MLLLSSAMSSNALASNIFFVWEGAELSGDDGAVSLALRDEYVSLLTGAGHSVTERALTTFVSGGTATQNNGAIDVIAGSLNASFDQVWVLNIVGSATPQNLSANDLSALSSWSAANSRDEWILDGLSWRGVNGTPRGNMNTDEENFTINMANVLEGAGGGILVGTDNEQGPLANPADGSGSLVATVNQVLDEFNFDLFFGAYRTAASTFTFGGSFFSGPGSLPATPTNFATSTGSYSEIPVGLQPNGRTLFSAVEGLGTPISGFNSPVLPGNVNHVLSTTISEAAIPAPEPGSLTLLSLGLLTLWGRRRSR